MPAGAGPASASSAEYSGMSVCQPSSSSASSGSGGSVGGEPMHVLAVAGGSQGALTQAAAAELEVIRLLHRAAQTPEELLYHALELGRLGVLSHDTLEKLCTSLGLPQLSKASFGNPQPTAKPWAERLPAALPMGQQGLHPNTSRLANEFILLRKLGQGAMGYVFVARHRLDGNDYAIKVVPFWAKGGVDEPEAERVLREARALSKLNHPNVCRYYYAWIETDWVSVWDGGGRRHGGGKVSPYPNHTPTIPQPCPNHTPTMPRPCPGHAPTMPRPCPNHTPTIPQPCPNHAPTMPQPYPNHTPTIPQPCPNHTRLFVDATPDATPDGTPGSSFFNLFFSMFTTTGVPLLGHSQLETSESQPQLNSAEGCSGVGSSGASSADSTLSRSWYTEADGWAENANRSSISSEGAWADTWVSSEGAWADSAACSNLSSVSAAASASGGWIGGGARSARACTNGARGAALSPRWSYRKALLIQMELCERRTLREYLSTRNEASFPQVSRKSRASLAQVSRKSLPRTNLS